MTPGLFWVLQVPVVICAVCIILFLYFAQEDDDGSLSGKE